MLCARLTVYFPHQPADQARPSAHSADGQEVPSFVPDKAARSGPISCGSAVPSSTPTPFASSRKELELVGPKAEAGNQLSREPGVEALKVSVVVLAFTDWATLGSFEPQLPRIQDAPSFHQQTCWSPWDVPGILLGSGHLVVNRTDMVLSS